MDVIDELIAHCEAWEPWARVMGNVCAGDAAQALRSLRARVETMEHALRVIDTWVAAERLMTDKQRTVVPKHVARIIAQVLGYGEKAR